jgi:hypothetical protein
MPVFLPVFAPECKITYGCNNKNIPEYIRNYKIFAKRNPIIQRAMNNFCLDLVLFQQKKEN